MEGSYRKLVSKLIKADLLIIVDWGLEPLNASQRSYVLELNDGRYDTHSTLIISQLPINSWYDMIGESTHADAILDRLVHRSLKMELQGESMRKVEKSLIHGCYWAIFFMLIRNGFGSRDSVIEWHITNFIVSINRNVGTCG